MELKSSKSQMATKGGNETMKYSKRMKTAATVALAATLMLPLGGLGLAAGEDVAEPEPRYELVARNESFPSRVWGSCVELGNNSLTLENSNEKDLYQKIVVNVGEDTLILDAVSGAEKTFADIKQDETLYAWVGPEIAESLPPIAYARVILCGIPADFGVPTYAEVLSVGRTDEGVSAYINNEVVLHLGEETEYVAAPGDASPLTADDLQPGMRVLAWYNMVALSMPGQASPSKMMILDSRYDGWVTAHGNAVSINGDQLDLTGANAPMVADNRLLVPMRKVAEALGFDVSWEAYTNQVVVAKDGTELYHFSVGAGQVSKGDVTVGLLTPALAVDGVTFIALDDLISLHNLKLAKNWF